MAGSFAFKVSAPRLNQDAIRVELLAALEKQSKLLVKEFEKTTKTWHGEKPEFEAQIGLEQGSGATLEVALTGPQKGIDKWFWLDRGTKVRRALMSRDWQSKTTPGLIGSGPGRGRVLFVSRQLALPGIEAREWAKLIRKNTRPTFRAALQAALARGLKRAQKG